MSCLCFACFSDFAVIVKALAVLFLGTFTSKGLKPSQVAVNQYPENLVILIKLMCERMLYSVNLDLVHRLHLGRKDHVPIIAKVLFFLVLVFFASQPSFITL